ncbi:MAG TPA: glycosyltransferase [Opitutaceae bacterium]|nr:glycosyltransferase [Opitutaceae bacterium]
MVTYNPDDSSLECIGTIIDAAVHTIIVDNFSGEASRAKLRRLKNEKISLIENNTNAGVAAGHNLGIQAALARGYRWFLLFDQDTKIFPSTIRSLIQVYTDCLAEFGDKLGLLGSNYYHLLEDGTIAEGKVPLCHGKAWSVENLIITSGTLIGWEKFQAIGPFREDFFIDHIDHDYCLRAQHRGLVIARTALPLTIHRLGQLTTRRPWLALGKKKLLSCYSPLRRYYQIRNFITLAREYEKEFPGAIGFIRQSIRRETMRALKYEGRFRRNLMSVVLAFQHSRRGITGKYAGRIAL